MRSHCWRRTRRLLACGVSLARGLDLDLRERRGDPRARGHAAGRSINLAISARGLKALRRAGLEETILRNAIRMPGRMIHSRAGAQEFQQYSRDPNHAIQSVSRSALNLALLEAAAAEKNVGITFHQRCVEVAAASGTVIFIDDNTKQTSNVVADLIVGADGAYSALRGIMQKNEGFDYSQKWLGHGYKEMQIQPVTSGAHAPFAMNPNALHIWPRGASMMIALPNPDGSFTCTLFWPHSGSGSFAEISGAANGRAHFQRDYADALPLMPTFDADFDANPVGSMLTVRCNPWSQGGRVVLLGDAAHAIVPFFGQGANASFEDCESLTDALAAHGDNIAAAISAYELDRKRNADAIAEMALTNFVEMRDKTASRMFKWKKKLDHFMHAMSPKFFIPRYDMVSFSNIPYADALKKSHKQNVVLARATVIILCCLSVGVQAVIAPQYKKDFISVALVIAFIWITFKWIRRRARS
ncbi:MAG: FAD-dependent monooxygenase [Verrucomicrobia bacterium]|nr:FAD-dependent monooxygenase [Verrucomicrobiota bacterium]